MNKILRTYRFIKNLPVTIHTVMSNIQSLSQKTKTLAEDLKAFHRTIDEEIDVLNHRLENIKQQQADVLHSIINLKQPKQKALAKKDNTEYLQANNHELDSYYVAFEEKFRGSEDVIYERLKNSYKTLYDTKLDMNLKKLPAIDIGCGRGELLKLYEECGLSGLGVDLNKTMVEQCVAKGYKAIQADALAYLREQPSGSIACISGIHIVEHIPFELLFDLLNECFRVVAPGGFVLFETPNPENLTVGSLTFWYDSSHLKPVPPEVLGFILDYVGFSKTEIMRLHPSNEVTLPKEPKNRLDLITKKIFGPRDYAAIGYKLGNQ